MPTYIAIFGGASGPVTAGMFTIDEFNARCNITGTIWGVLINSQTGKVVREWRLSATNEETKA